MILKNSLCFFSLLWLSTAVQAQQNETATPVQIRAVLHDPVNPTAELFLTDNTGAVVKLELRPQDLSRPQVTVAVNGSLVLYDKAVIDPKKPEASLAASCKIPPSTKRGVVVILPGPAGSKPAYRMVFLDDSAKAFPKGESRILTLIPLEAAIEAGEHKLPIHPGGITNLPPVKKVNEYNMAQTNFYFKQGEVWTAITERQLQYLDDVRRIFIVHATPRALLPVVTTIVDTTTPQ
jgi:hypothetical protein